MCINTMVARIENNFKADANSTFICAHDVYIYRQVDLLEAKKSTTNAYCTGAREQYECIATSRSAGQLHKGL